MYPGHRQPHAERPQDAEARRQRRGAPSRGRARAHGRWPNRGRDSSTSPNGRRRTRTGREAPGRRQSPACSPRACPGFGTPPRRRAGPGSRGRIASPTSGRAPPRPGERCGAAAAPSRPLRRRARRRAGRHARRRRGRSRSARAACGGGGGGGGARSSTSTILPTPNRCEPIHCASVAVYDRQVGLRQQRVDHRAHLAAHAVLGTLQHLDEAQLVGHRGGRQAPCVKPA